MPHYLADLRADFLRFFRIDLEDCDLDGRSFVQLAERVIAYGGVMAARVAEIQEQEQLEQGTRPRRTAEPEKQHMELAEARVAFPGLITVTKVSTEEVE